jgi:hypothetical protein
MAIYEQSREDCPPPQIIAELLSAAAALESPHPHHDTSGGNIPVILWSLALLLGVLAILARGPREAPAFDTLTAFTCDPLPALRTGWNRTMWPVYYTCRAGNKFVYQRGMSPSPTKGTQWQACRRAGGVIKIWRYDNPSPYGSFVFQMTCDDQIYADYKTRAANYVAIHATGMLVAAGLIILSLIGLAARLHFLRHHRTTPYPAG